MKNEEVDVLVIGAGPAGTVAASIIHQQGFKVKVVEREKFPRFVIGESLLPRVMDHLEAAGFMDDVKAAGFQEKFGAKFLRGEEVCDFNFKDQFSNGFTWTWQVPRAQFDTILAASLQKKGVEVEFQSAVTTIVFSDSNSITTVRNQSGEEKSISARYIVDASGYGRVIPRMFNLDKPSNFESRKTYFTHFKDLKRPQGIDGNRITVIIHELRTWIWIIPFSNGITSVGFVADPQFFEKAPTAPEMAMRYLVEQNENLRDRFLNAEMIFEPRTIEGYAISTKQLFGKGFVLCGNATEFLDPVFSSGVTFAMESGHKAALLVCKQLNNEKVDWQNDYTEYMMQGINTFRTYVSSWYNGDLHEIFFSMNQEEEFKKQICSVLAGYVWDMENPFVRKHKQAVESLAKLIRHRKAEAPKTN